MLNDLKIVCVLPAYNAAKTLAQTLAAVDSTVVDLFILVDDHSADETLNVALELKNSYPLQIFRHEKNLGYGANQKTCYKLALDAEADVVVMLHPDYQYEPKLLGALATLVTSGIYDVALGSRILGQGALKGGMPAYKYFFNRILTAIENILIGQKLSEYHTGYRAFSKKVLNTLNIKENSNNFVFDNEILVQAHLANFQIGEISVPTKYFAEASSIGFLASVAYGLGVLRASIQGFLARTHLWTHPRFRINKTFQK